MTDPYEPPKVKEKLDRLKRNQGCKEPMIGCGVGGCCIPMILILLCGAILKDTGGPLIWPIMSVLLGAIGLIVGFVFQPRR